MAIIMTLWLGNGAVLKVQVNGNLKNFENKIVTATIGTSKNLAAIGTLKKM